MSGTAAPARLRENIVALSVLQALNYVVPLVTVPYLVRVLGPAHFGLIAFAQALIIYFDLLTNYGFSFSATRTVACCRENPGAVAKIFWRTTYAKTAMMLLSAAILGMLVVAVPRFRATPWLYCAAFLTVVGTVTFPVWFFQGIEQMRFITLAQASARLLSIPALLMVVRSPADYVYAAAIQGGVPLLASIILAPALLRRVPTGPPRPSASDTWAALREGWHPFVAQTGLVINSSTTTVVLGLVAGNNEVGYYGAADKVIKAVTSLLAPVAQALYPHLNALKVRSRSLTFGLMRTAFAWVGVLALAASLATLFLARPAGLLLWGSGFYPSIVVLRCLAPLPVLFALINIMGVQTMLVLEMDSVLSRILFAGVVLNAGLAAVLSAMFGAVGAAAATVAAALAVAASLAWKIARVRALAYQAF
jgi:polysaccharide transporter, PST family